jgi:hypothetical protein
MATDVGPLNEVNRALPVIGRASKLFARQLTQVRVWDSVP